MAEIDKMMVSDGNGGQKQVYPQTHAAAVIDIEKYAGNGPKGEDGKDGANGLSAYEIAKKNGYTGTEKEWLASLKGATGAPGKDGATGATGAPGKNGADGKQGPKGDPGLSAYQVAKANGYTGTETEWLTSLKGKDGTNGTNATTTAVATQTANGLMSKEDKKKLDGLSNSGITFVKVKDV